jgi:hypothetical protein
MVKLNKGWKWRDKELSMKEFYSLPQTSRNEYISLIEKLSQQERSSGDNIILNQYGKNINRVKEFLSLEDSD